MQGFNKYYPPDYDPNQHSSLNAYRGKHALGDRARKIDQGILITRFELPFNIWCNGCENHIGMGVRYNAEKKKVGNYLSTPIYAFRCKCHLCDNWFVIETDPKNTRYVVKEGARKKDEEWDPEENGGFAIHDPDKAGPSDPLAALEKTTQAEHQLATIGKPRIAELASLSEHYNADPYIHSYRARRFLRAEKKVEASKVRADNAVRDKYGLPEDLKLAPGDDKQLVEESKAAFNLGRRERKADEDASRRRMEAETGRTSVSPFSIPGDRTKRHGAARTLKSQASTSSATGAAFSLRSRLLQNTSRKSDPFLVSNRTKPPDVKSLGVKLKN